MIQVFPTEIRQGMSMSSTYILLLSSPDEEASIPVLVGAHEAQSIVLAQKDIHPRRPMTHTLLCNIMEAYGLTLKQVLIYRFEEGIFYARLTMTDDFNEKIIDSRTSDAVTLALQLGCPIYCDEKVFRETAITPASMRTPDEEEATQITLKELELQLKECEDNEDYEQAALIMEQIKKLKGL